MLFPARLLRWLARVFARVAHRLGHVRTVSPGVTPTAPSAASPPGRAWPPAWQVLAVLFVAVGLRAAWVCAVPSHPVGDFALYMESAEDLVEGGRLDDHFIYMPGYVLALAAVKGLGGGLLACKLVGVAAAGLGALGVMLLGARAGGPSVALLAGGLYAGWPAGIAVGSVTGTDAPTGSLIVLAVGLLTELSARRRPRAAALTFGLVMGVAAWIRAIAWPLSLFSFFVLRAYGTSFRRSLSGVVLSICAATALLAPWAFRNHTRYGAWFFTDSHGGHTALVGSNPNTDGAYSRSLNRLFTDVTGYRLFDEPARHRASDRAAYDLAKELVRFEPRYALGLLALKADRLLSHERNLLYWPLYRQGVLQADARTVAEAWRPTLERTTDLSWYALLTLSVAATLLASFVGRRDIMSWLPFPALLIGIYVWFFAEVRYHLAFAPFLFPLAAWLLVQTRRQAREHRRQVFFALCGALALLGLAWPACLHLGEGLRERHRFAATEVIVDASPALALWRRVLPHEGPSPVHGTGNLLGLQVSEDGVTAAETTLALSSGQWQLQLSAATTQEAGLDAQDLRDETNGSWLSVKVDEQEVLREVIDRSSKSFMKSFFVPRGGRHTLIVRVLHATRTRKVFVDDLRFLREK